MNLSEISTVPTINKDRLLERLTAAGTAALTRLQTFTAEERAAAAPPPEVVGLISVLMTVKTLVEAILRGDYDTREERTFSAKESN